MSTRRNLSGFSGWMVVLAAGSAATVAGLAGAPVLGTQSRAPLKFTTSSVTRGATIFGVAPTIADGRFVWQSASPALVIRYAYEAASPTIEGKVPVDPGYDIEATFDPSATSTEIREMLRNLLIERFALRVHKDIRRMPFLKLGVAAGGHKLVPAIGRPVMVQGWTLQPGASMGYQDRANGTWHVAAVSVTTGQLARVFADNLQQPVIDATGIRGVFTINIATAGPPGPKTKPQFRAAVQEQLGLMLEETTGNVEMLVVDHIKLP